MALNLKHNRIRKAPVKYDVWYFQTETYKKITKYQIDAKPLLNLTIKHVCILTYFYILNHYITQELI